MELFDTHAHLSDEAFDEDRHSLIPKLFESGVTRIIDVACDVRTADRTIELIDRYPFIYGTVGMHPHDVSAMDNALMDRISDILQHKKCLLSVKSGWIITMTFPRAIVRENGLRNSLSLQSSSVIPLCSIFAKHSGTAWTFFTHTVTDCAELCIAIPEALKRHLNALT